MSPIPGQAAKCDYARAEAKALLSIDGRVSWVSSRHAVIHDEPWRGKHGRWYQLLHVSYNFQWREASSRPMAVDSFCGRMPPMCDGNFQPHHIIHIFARRNIYISARLFESRRISMAETRLSKQWNEFNAKQLLMPAQEHLNYQFHAAWYPQYLKSPPSPPKLYEYLKEKFLTFVLLSWWNDMPARKKIAVSHHKWQLYY